MGDFHRIGAMGLALATLTWGLAGTANAAAQTQGEMSYTIDLTDYAVTNIMIVEDTTNGIDFVRRFPPFTAAVGTTVITDSFAVTDPVLASYLIGVTTGLPGDVSGEEHLVLFTNDAWVAAAVGQS